MPGYTTRLLTIRLGGHDFRIRALSDLQQFADPPEVRTVRAFPRHCGVFSARSGLPAGYWPKP